MMERRGFRERAPMDRKTKSKSKSTTLTTPRWKLFDEPHLLEDEDAAMYHELLARIRAAVKPGDIIDEMLIDDVVSWEWEVLRRRRWKAGLFRTCELEALKTFLRKNLDYDEDRFTDHLTETLQHKLPEPLPEHQAQTLARECARDEPAANEKVNKLLAGIRQNLDLVEKDEKAERAKGLVQKYARHEPDAVGQVDALLTGAGTSMDVLVANALAEKLDDIERIDRLMVVAEGRRNASLREIERRRVVPRGTVQAVEDAEYKVIETMAKG